jgi:hypothetical protein
LSTDRVTAKMVGEAKRSARESTYLAIKLENLRAEGHDL